MRISHTFISMLWVATAAGCIGEISSIDEQDDGDDGSGSATPVTCDQARMYTGFGGDLTADRPTIAAGTDRVRLKPFTALAAEYAAALKLPSFNTAVYAATFGRPPARWYQEPQASANTIYAAFALAYDGCTQHVAATGGADFNTAPASAIAERLCRDFAKAAWHRDATDAEATTCATFAVTKTNPADAPAKRWAYTCAAVLSASDFLSY